MQMFVNTSGVPVNFTNPKLYGRILGGSDTDITSHHYQVRKLRCSSIWPYGEVFEQKRPSVFVVTKC